MEGTPNRFSRAYRAVAVSVTQARKDARKAACDLGQAEFADIVEEIVSELTTNALRSKAPFTVDVEKSDSGQLLIEVFDTHPGTLVNRQPSSEDPNGRGLMIVRALSETCGVRPAAGGKVVFAVVGTAVEAVQRVPA